MMPEENRRRESPRPGSPRHTRRIILFASAMLLILAVAVGIAFVATQGSSGGTSASSDVAKNAVVMATPEPTSTPVPTSTPQIVYITEKVPVEKIVEVPVVVEKEVIKEVIKEVPVEVVREVEVIKEVIKEVKVLVTPTPTPPPVPLVCKVDPLNPEEFGKTIYARGLVEVKLLGGNSVNAAFLFHLKEGTDPKVAVVYALCDDWGKVVSTAMVRNYRQGEEFEYAKVTQYFAEAPKREYIYDRGDKGQPRVIMTQQFSFDSPVMHALSPEERIGGSNLNELLLYTRDKNTLVEAVFDDKGGVRFKVTYTDVTATNRMESAFRSLKFILDQVEAKR